MDRPEWKSRTHALIDRARARGVQQIILTIRSNNPNNVGPDGYFPNATVYGNKITALVEEFAGKVDAWGPANEPNGAWRPSTAPGGQAQLPPVYAAAYYFKMRGAVNAHDGTATVTSVDFLDDWGSLQNFNDYLTAYKNATGGDWGDVVAFHPYRDTRNAQLTYTNALASAAPGKNIWVTEVGAEYKGDATAQNARVSWIANTLANHSRVKRITYYSMRGSGFHSSTNWDTGLLNPNRSRRPAWYTWCAAAHGDNAAHPDCRPLPLHDSLGVHNDAGGNCLTKANTSNSSCDIFFTFGDGSENQIMVGDWNGDGIDTLGIHNDAGGNCLTNTNASNSSCDAFFTFGDGSENQIMVGDWNGDGIDTLGIHNDAGGNCLTNTNASNGSCDIFFLAGAGSQNQPIIGDWNGDGIDTFGVHNDAGGNCLINANANNSSCDIYFTFGSGSHNQVIVGNWGP
jgi:hypothetical protein